MGNIGRAAGGFAILSLVSTALYFGNQCTLISSKNRTSGFSNSGSGINSVGSTTHITNNTEQNFTDIRQQLVAADKEQAVSPSSATTKSADVEPGGAVASAAPPIEPTPAAKPVAESPSAELPPVDATPVESLAGAVSAAAVPSRPLTVAEQEALKCSGLRKMLDIRSVVVQVTKDQRYKVSISVMSPDSKFRYVRLRSGYKVLISDDARRELVADSDIPWTGSSEENVGILNLEQAKLVFYSEKVAEPSKAISLRAHIKLAKEISHDSYSSDYYVLSCDDLVVL
jgi:hypothetical protein